MSSNSVSPESVVTALGKVRMRLGPIMRDIRNPRLQKLWNGEWKGSILSIEQENEGRPEVAIALVGGTGSGKSTLLNALLDRRVLPVSNMRACTAAISEVSFRPGTSFSAEVTFIARDSRQREINYLQADIADRSASTGDSAERVTATELSRAARDKIRAVYRVEDDAPIQAFHLTKLREPPEIKRALDLGTIRFEMDDFDEFRSKVREYLDSKGPYWPIVETVRLRGPFEALSGGVKVIDLPGINDPNEAREQVTRQYLKTCRFVWIVFNIKRILTRDINSLMQSDDFIRQVVMDGRESALTFVGTASDDLDFDAAREEFELNEDAEDAAVVGARNSAARDAVQSQLTDLARGLAESANDAERASGLIAAFQQCTMLTTSALDYLVLSGLARNKSTLETLEQTEIQQLREHMQQISESYGIEAQSKSLHRRIDIIFNQMLEACAKEKASLEQSAVFNAARRKEMAEAIARLDSFLVRSLGDCHERFVQDLGASQDLLKERLKRAIERGAADLDHTIVSWKRIHWCTMRAISRRGGKFVSPTSGAYDLPREIAKPVLDGITFAWTDFFGDQMRHRLDKWTAKLLVLAQQHGIDLLKDLFRIVPTSQDKLHKDFGDVVEVTEKVVNELLGQASSQMIEKLDEVRRALYDEIPYQIGVDMREAFLQASDEKGTGMKMHMIELLSKHATTVSADMFTRTEERISQGVRELVDQLGRSFTEMTGTVRKHTSLPVDNLVDAEKLPEEEIAVMLHEVGTIDTAIVELREDPDVTGAGPEAVATSDTQRSQAQSVSTGGVS